MSVSAREREEGRDEPACERDGQLQTTVADPASCFRRFVRRLRRVCQVRRLPGNVVRMAIHGEE